MALPNTLEMLETLIGEPSVSCIDKSHDQSNLGVVNHLATWLDDLGFAVELLPVPDKPGQEQRHRPARQRGGWLGALRSHRYRAVRRSACGNRIRSR